MESLYLMTIVTMALTDVYNLYRHMEDENIILSFKGEFTSDLLTSILHIMEEKMKTLEITQKKKKRVFNVLVECFQNLYHHIESISQNEEEALYQKSALILVTYHGERMTVKTGNFISNDGIEALEDRLELVNELSPEELRDLYQKRLLSNSLSEKGTAGLGLIDIARKSKSKLGHEFIKIDDNCSFFCLTVEIE